MFDRKGIYKRFASCYEAETPLELAKTLTVKHPTVYQWRSGVRLVPWKRMKSLIDDQNICWDWLLEGKEPKHRGEQKKSSPLSRKGINGRFLKLFQSMTQIQLAELFSVSQPVVACWYNNTLQVSWEKLKAAVDDKGMTWDWLLEGI